MWEKLIIPMLVAGMLATGSTLSPSPSSRVRVRPEDLIKPP